MKQPWYVLQQEALASQDSIKRLGLSSRPENALIRAGYWTVTQALDLLEMKPRPDVRNLGAKGWKELEEAVERPMQPLSNRE